MKEYRILGFLYSLIFSASMIYLVFFCVIPFIKGTYEYADYSKIALTIVILAAAYVSLRSLKILKNEKSHSKIKEGFDILPKFISNIINFVLCLIVYIFGIGLVSIISKVFKKKYLDLKKSGSSWIVKREDNNKESCYRMF